MVLCQVVSSVQLLCIEETWPAQQVIEVSVGNLQPTILVLWIYCRPGTKPALNRWR